MDHGATITMATYFPPQCLRRKESPARCLLCCKMAVITLLKTSITPNSPTADAVASPALTIT